ncbi:hypothetical protein [Streptomyces hokutonensis]|uniref:Transposase for insertion sequence element IS21-like C-terminal domain-containing protein n=1 Tax=Streptomyces hokutonensis TaxID=1306990 RepID=A0ABW6M7Y0_9ACTN
MTILPCPPADPETKGGPRRRAAEALLEEQQRLHPLPKEPVHGRVRPTRRVNRKSTISVEGVRYSVPHRLVDTRDRARFHRVGAPINCHRSQLHVEGSLMATSPQRPVDNSAALTPRTGPHFRAKLPGVSLPTGVTDRDAPYERPGPRPATWFGHHGPHTSTVPEESAVATLMLEIWCGGMTAEVERVPGADLSRTRQAETWTGAP